MNFGKETETLEFKKSTGEMKEAMISIANKHRGKWEKEQSGTVPGSCVKNKRNQKGGISEKGQLPP